MNLWVGNLGLESYWSPEKSVEKGKIYECYCSSLTMKRIKPLGNKGWCEKGDPLQRIKQDWNKRVHIFYDFMS